MSLGVLWEGFLWLLPHPTLLFVLLSASTQCIVWKSLTKIGDFCITDHKGFLEKTHFSSSQVEYEERKWPQNVLVFSNISPASLQNHIIADPRWMKLTGSCRDSFLFVFLKLSCSFFAIAKGSHSSSTKTCEKTLGFWKDSFTYPGEEMLAHWNLKCSVPFSPLSCKSSEWDLPSPHSLLKTLSMGYRNLHLGQFPVVWLLRGNSANINPRLFLGNLWSIL